MAGAISNDRKLGAEVRRLGLNKVKTLFKLDYKEMTDKQREMHDELLKRMAPNFVPRLTEITGEDGAAVIVQVAKEIADKNNVTDTSSSPDSKGSAPISGS